MRYHEINGILNEIENGVAIEKIEYGGMRIWPIVRLQVWKQLRHGISQNRNGKTTFGDSLVGLTKKISRHLGQLSRWLSGRRVAYPAYDAVFLIARLERTFKMDGKYYSRFSNSLQEVATSIGINSTTLDLSRSVMPVYGQTYFIDRETVSDHIKNKIGSFGRTPAALPWRELEDFVSAKFPQIKLDRGAIIRDAQAVLDYQNIFERILGQIRPKIGFLECYYHPTAMGYIRACRKLGIKAVDLQHGEQHGMYRGWANLPKGGYDIMPEFFWCWGEESAREINAWSRPIHPEHLAFVGGNPWISKLLKEREAIREQTGQTMNVDINVLVAIPNKDFPMEHLYEAVKRSPPEVRWHIRLHPMRMRDRAFRNKIAAEFGATGNNNLEIENENSISFYEALPKMDFMVTPWSTAAYEALAFKVHPIIISSESLSVFKAYADKGLFSLAETADAILEVLKKDKSKFNFNEDMPYIETDISKLEQVLSDLYKGKIQK